MLNHSEIIETGFSALRSTQPGRSLDELLVRAKRQDRRTRIVRVGLSSASFVVAVSVAAVALRPTSALASLTHSIKLSGAQPLIHIRFSNNVDTAPPASPPWPKRPDLDIWKFRDHYVRKEGTSLTEQFKDGRMLTYDSRFPFGIRMTYEAAKDGFWNFDGTVGIDFQKLYRNPPSVSDVERDGKKMLDYVWQDTNSVGTHTTEHVFVDPDTKLICAAAQLRRSSDGSQSSGSAVVEYPREDSAPRLSSSTVLKTKAEAFGDFRRRIGEPVQSKTVGGVKTTLYGVIAHPNIPDGIAVQVLTTGGAGPDYGSGHQPEVLNASLLPVKRSEWFPSIGDPSHNRFGRTVSIGNRRYVMNESNDLLPTAPKKITVKVPVWRLNVQTHEHEFIGFVTFTTSKIFYAVGIDWNYCGQ